MPDEPQKYAVGADHDLTLTEISNRSGVSIETLKARLKHGWTGKKLLTPTAHRGAIAKTHDFGDGRQLTSAQASALSGIKIETIRRRLRKGVKPAELLNPEQRGRGHWTKARPEDLNDSNTRYSVCDGKRLTVEQIAQITRISTEAVSRRIAIGVRGCSLLKPSKYKI